MQAQFTRRLSKTPPMYPNSIRDYRLEAGLTQAALAALLGKRRSTISGWERGRCLPNVGDALRLARSLNTLAEALYARLYGMAVPEDKPTDPNSS